MKAVPALAQAYSLTGDGKYAARCAFFLDLVASIYPESTAGSWDYPSSPPSGRLARPWYQVSRVLHILAGVYDLIYEDRSLDEGSLRPRLEMKFPATDGRKRGGGGLFPAEPDEKGKHRPQPDARRSLLLLFQDI